MDKVVKDALGNEIEIGDIITYPGRQSSSMWLNYAVVIGIEWTTGPWRTSEEIPVLKAVRVEEEMRWATINSKYAKVSKAPPVFKTRQVRVEAIHRVIRIPNTMLNPDTSPAHQELLDLQTQCLVGALTN